MKKLLLLLLLLNTTIVLNAQRSETQALKINKKYATSFISDKVKVQSGVNNPFIAFSIALRGVSINQNIDAVYYKNIQNQWQLFTVDENNNEKNVWYALSYLEKNIVETQIKIIFNKSAQVDVVTYNFYFPKDTEYLFKKSKKSIIAPINVKNTEDCGCAKPTTIPRTTWCPDNNCPPNSSPAATDVKFLVVHHTAGANTSSDWAAVVRSIWNYHVNTRGWADIGYNFLLDKEGNIYDARADDTRGAHFSGHNTGTSGIALMGTFTSVVPTTTMLSSLENLLAWKSCDKNIDPLAVAYHASSGLNLYTIPGHRDGGSTECPGNEVYNLLPTIRSNVNTQLSACALAVDENEIKKDVVYPNPFTDKVTIKASQITFDIEKMQCYDVMGRLVFEKNKIDTKSTTVLDLDFLSSGIYILRVLGDQKTAHIRLIKD